MKLTLTLWGTPKGAKRHRMTVRGGHARAFTAADQLAEERHQVVAFREALPAGWPTEAAYSVVLECYFPRPARLRRVKDQGSGPRPAPVKPDVDNVAKLVLDAATRAGVWRDDAAVVDLAVRKRYLGLSLTGEDEGVPRVEVVIESW